MFPAACAISFPQQEQPKKNFRNQRNHCGQTQYVLNYWSVLSTWCACVPSTMETHRVATAPGESKIQTSRQESIEVSEESKRIFLHFHSKRIEFSTNNHS